jgi:hypothetical protein
VRRSSLDRDPLLFHIPRSTLSEVAPQTPAIIQTLDAFLEVADDRYLILVRIIYTDSMTEFLQLRSVDMPSALDRRNQAASPLKLPDAQLLHPTNRHLLPKFEACGKTLVSLAVTPRTL